MANTIIVKLAIASDLVDFKYEKLIHDRIRMDLVYPATESAQTIIDDVVTKLAKIEAAPVVGFMDHSETYKKWIEIFTQQIVGSTSLHDLRHRLHIDGPMPNCNHGASTIHFFGSLSVQTRLEDKDVSDTVHEYYDISVTGQDAIEFNTLERYSV